MQQKFIPVQIITTQINKINQDDVHAMTTKFLKWQMCIVYFAFCMLLSWRDWTVVILEFSLQVATQTLFLTVKITIKNILTLKQSRYF